METLCILAAGRGERVRSVSSLHKSLLPVDNRAVLSHIIEKVPADAEIVIAVGHQKELIRAYCLAAHPERRFIFVPVDNFDGPGSGPGYSLHCCRPFLQKPFYLCCSDCIVLEPWPDLSGDWIGVQAVDDPRPWSTARVEGSRVTAFRNKSPEGYEYAFIGVAGIRSFEVFWDEMREGDKEFEMVSAFYRPESYPSLTAVPFTWYDAGTTDNYRRSQSELTTGKQLGMPKTINEMTYKVAGRCVKLFGNGDICMARIARQALFGQLSPVMTHASDHAYSYDWVNGTTMYEANDPSLLLPFLTLCQDKLWRPIPTRNFERLCHKFYQDKSLQRLDDYLSLKASADTTATIQGRCCPPVREALGRLNWNVLTKGRPVTFHGDLQFENVIVTEDRQFVLIDWRDSFAGCLYGDVYYDLAKLNACLGMSFDAAKRQEFVITKSDCVHYEFTTTPEIKLMREMFATWLRSNGFDVHKVETLTALVYLNMAPLHTSPFDELLFYHARWLLAGLD